MKNYAFAHSETPEIIINHQKYIYIMSVSKTQSGLSLLASLLTTLCFQCKASVLKGLLGLSWLACIILVDYNVSTCIRLIMVN